MGKDNIPNDNSAPTIDPDNVLDVEALALRTGIAGDQAQALIDRIGNDREALEQAVRELKKPMMTKTKTEGEDKKAQRLAETTDVSPQQAKDLMREHGKDSPEVEKEAKNFKAEG